MTVLDDGAVAVETFAELRSVLQESNLYTTVYLAADISMTAGIAILPSKTQVTIDGLYPLDGTGTVHTLSEYRSADAGYTLGIRSASSISMTVRNMNIVGQNYYGILYVPEGSGYTGVTVTYQNITYVGPQITYNPSGKTRYIDCRITLQAAYSGNNELGEVYQVEMGGTVTVNQTSASYPVFWFRGNASSPSLTVLSGADVTLNAGRDLFYTTYPLAMAVEEGARLAINTQSGVSRSSSYRFASVHIDRDAVFRVIQAAANGSNATLYCNGAFTVSENASVYMQANYNSAPPLIHFYTTGARLNLNKPKSFVLYNSSANAMYFQSSTAISIEAGQVNAWLTSTPLATAGTLGDVPTLAWYKADQTPLQVSATGVGSLTTVQSDNLTAEEAAALPEIGLMQLSVARIVSVGDVPLVVDPVVDGDTAVTGTTAPGAEVAAAWEDADYRGTGDGTGAFRVDADSPIPTDTAVTVRAHLPFLITTVVVAVRAGGKLTLDHAPDSLPFRIAPIRTGPVLFGRETTGWSITVTDSRARSGAWYLYASIDRPMTGEHPGRTLPGSLVYVDEAGVAAPLSDLPTLVYTGEGNGGGTKTTAVSWAEDRGVLMRAVDQPFYNGERYTAAITWTLSDTAVET